MCFIFLVHFCGLVNVSAVMPGSSGSLGTNCSQRSVCVVWTGVLTICYVSGIFVVKMYHSRHSVRSGFLTQRHSQNFSMTSAVSKCW